MVFSVTACPKTNVGTIKDAVHQHNVFYIVNTKKHIKRREFLFLFKCKKIAVLIISNCKWYSYYSLTFFLFTTPNLSFFHSFQQFIFKFHSVTSFSYFIYKRKDSLERIFSFIYEIHFFYEYSKVP